MVQSTKINLSILITFNYFKVPTPSNWSLTLCIFVREGNYEILRFEATLFVHIELGKCSSKYVYLFEFNMLIRCFTNFEITVACGLKFHWYLRTLSLKFQKATCKIEILNLKSSNTNETLGHTPQ